MSRYTLSCIHRWLVGLTWDSIDIVISTTTVRNMGCISVDRTRVALYMLRVWTSLYMLRRWTRWGGDLYWSCVGVGEDDGEEESLV